MLASMMLAVCAMTPMSPPKPLPRARPSEVGVDARGVTAFLDALNAADLEPHGFMLVRKGKVVAEGSWDPYKAETPHMLYSLSKSFTSTAVGLAIHEGLFALDDPVIKFFPDDLPAEVSPNLKAMRVRDLLTMSCGHESEPQVRTVADGNWAKGFLAHPVPRKPGTHFVYNSLSTYMAGAIVQKLTGKTLLEYLRPRILEPLGIVDGGWDSDPRGLNVGGWGLNVTLESIAKFGQLYLKKGVWNGKRLIPEAWVNVATSKQVSNGSDPNNDWNQGYGFQFWRCRHNGYRGDGAFGQFCIVLPDQEAVIAITSGHHDMGQVMELAWKHLLPAMGKTTVREGEAELLNRLGSLELRPRGTQPRSDLEQAINKTAYRVTEGDAAKSLRLEFATDQVTLWLDAMPLRAGRADWVTQTSAIGFGQPRPLAAKATWKTATELAIKACDVETPGSFTVTLKFEADRVNMAVDRLATFMPGEGPRLVASRR